jgi:hypothetical protein
MTRRAAQFQTIRSEGGLLPPDLLGRVIDPKAKLPGTRPEDYGLPKGERLNEVITQSWNRLRKHWAEFRAAAEQLPATETGTALTNDKWNLPLLRELGFGPLPASPGPSIHGRSYAINRFVGPVPIHLVGCNLSLDRRAAGVRGAAAANPHGLVQEFLNRSTGHLWALVSNGLRLRLLRDNQALSRQSFLEFDLEAMFAGEVFSDFVLLWLTAHATRFAPQGEAQRPETCWLEQWTKLAEEQGTRALGELRGGVERALQILGEGFTSHPKNTALREALRSGKTPPPDFHGQLLRVVYRLIFLFVAEDRTLDGLPLLHPRDDSDAARTARERYAAHYSTGRLRDLAGKIKGSRHGDLWRQFQLLVGALSGAAEFEALRGALALPTLGSFLWDPANTAALNDAELTNHDFLEALRHLAFTRQGKVLRPVDYKNLGAEELGGVYEGLLALTPQISADGARFGFAEFAGNERKTSGSYYTPDSLVQCLLDSALDPVVDEAIKGKTGADAEQAILALKVCDPAVGSGHFLVGAAHRLARHLARVRALAQGDSEPSPLLYQHALRDVIGRCLYGVDLNPMAAELCRVSLWLEALEPGKPLSFLDHHIRVGNSLIGATPELIAAGIPDDAFKPIEGDDPAFCRDYKRQNKRERESRIDDLFGQDGTPWEHLGNLAAAMTSLDDLDDGTVEGVREKSAQYEALVQGSGYLYGHLLADAWCAAFVWPKRETPEHPFPITTDMVRKIEETPFHCPPWMREEIERLAGQYRFFHWHLEFPSVCGPAGPGGFDLMLGNPPWDSLSPDRREFFGQYHAGMRSLSPDEQDVVIKQLVQDEAVAAAWALNQRDLFGLVHFLKNSGRFTLYAPGNLGKGDFNVYRMFIEHALRTVRDGGFAAQIVPAGFRGGANVSAIRQHVFDHMTLDLIVSFINAGGEFFPGVHGQFQFMMYNARNAGRTKAFNAAFGITTRESLANLQASLIPFTADFIRTNAPDTYTIPDVRCAADLTVAKKMLDAYPAFGDRSAGPPSRHYQRELDMGNDTDRFTTDPAGLPLYEGRMISHFDHRAKTYDSGHGNSSRWIERPFGDPAKAIVPQWRVLTAQIPDKLGDRCERYRLCFRDVAQPTDVRSFIAALIPPRVICGDKVPTLDFGWSQEWAYLPWLAVANSFAMDWMARSKLTSPKMSFTLVDSLPFPRPKLTDPWVQRSAPLVLRLICTAPEMTPFWNRMAVLGLCLAVPEGTIPPDALVDEAARELARAELDALIAHEVYGLTRDELADILETFPVVKKRDIAAYGDYRTKRMILETYDGMKAAKRTGEPRPPSLDPPLTAQPYSQFPKQ